MSIIVDNNTPIFTGLSSISTSNVIFSGGNVGIGTASPAAKLDVNGGTGTAIKISGGGELIDQGSHLIDLSEFFFGKIIKVEGTLRDYFWKKKVDDNAFLTLKFKNNLLSFLHVSCTEWKNNFLFEIYGSKGKLRIEGKGGSYGKEILKLYKMNRKNTYPKIFSWKFNKKDHSWSRELNEFYKDIQFNRNPNPGLQQASSVLHVIKKIYKINKYDHSS